MIDDPCISSTEDLVVDNLSVFPNPVVDVLQIRHEYPELAYELVHPNGTLVKQGQLKNGEQLGLQELLAGIYYLKLQHQGTFFVEKIIKAGRR